MSKNKKLDRRHDINAGGERLPERLTRVEDMEVYWDGIEKVMENDKDPDFKAQMQAKKDKEEAELAEKRASIKAGDIILLLWSGVQVVRAVETTETGVKVGPHRYGWEVVKKPSQTLLEALEKEVGALE